MYNRLFTTLFLVLVPGLGPSEVAAGTVLCQPRLSGRGNHNATIMPTAVATASIPWRKAAPAAGTAGTAAGTTGRALLQAPGAYGDAYSPNAADPWGTAAGYYDPYGAGYVPGFVNVDVSKEFGTHVDVGPVALDLTADYAGLALGPLAGVGIARDGRGFDVQLGNGNILDMSVTREAGFGLWLLNGLVNINIGPDGRWNMVGAAATTAASLAAAGATSAAAAQNAVTVQGSRQDAVARAATAASTAPRAAAAAAATSTPAYPAAAARAPSLAVPPPRPAVVSPSSLSPPPPTPLPAASPPPPVAPAPRRPCEGGTIVSVIGNKYVCKYKKGMAPSSSSGR